MPDIQNCVMPIQTIYRKSQSDVTAVCKQQITPCVISTKDLKEPDCQST